MYQLLASYANLGAQSTYLAIFTAIANLSMRYAAIQGVVIAWWVKATKGSSLARLHWDYRSGVFMYPVATAYLLIANLAESK